MNLLPNWKEIAASAWSMWFLYAANVIMLAEMALGLFVTDAAPSWMRITLQVIILLAIPARLIDQNLRRFIEDEGGAAKRRAIVAAGTVAAVMALAVPMVEKWEGFRADAYRDVVGVWTIGYGETQNVRPGDTVTKQEAAEQLRERLINDYYMPVVACAPELADAPASVQAAVASWTYNIGVGAACKSTLARHIRAGEWRAACEQLPRWNRAGGQVWRGLTNRRADERGLCLSGVDQ